MQDNRLVIGDVSQASLLDDNSVITKVVDTHEYVMGEFWTAKQRQANRIHEISYRACFKPALVRYFINRLSKPGDVVYDPFMGRGTTPIEAALNNRIPCGNDINPLCLALTEPRINPPNLTDIIDRFKSIDLNKAKIEHQDLLHFYHPDTLKKLEALRSYFLNKSRLDQVDKFIRMVVINRLTGHSSGFLSVYTLPPNQAVSVKSQIKINQKRGQVPQKRDLEKILMKKSRILLSGWQPQAEHVVLTVGDSRDNQAIKDGQVALTITSPPFLNEVNYTQDNWLRCWFLGIDSSEIDINMHSTVEDWSDFIHDTLRELVRVTKVGGHIAFEVGEVRKNTVALEKHVIDSIRDLPLKVVKVLINRQKFTKTSNCWGVANNGKGTNSNRVIVMTKVG